MSETGEQWKPCTSIQTLLTRRPVFVWDARIMMYPALPVYVHDAYVARVGVLHGAIFGLLFVVNMPDSLDFQRGQLMRYFMEALWYPIALLLSRGVCWQAIDYKSARATLTDAAIALTLTFPFLDNGLIDSVLAVARSLIVNGVSSSMLWQGRLSVYCFIDNQHDRAFIPFWLPRVWLVILSMIIDTSVLFQ
jgi:hypothetical protein